MQTNPSYTTWQLSLLYGLVSDTVTQWSLWIQQFWRPFTFHCCMALTKKKSEKASLWIRMDLHAEVTKTIKQNKQEGKILCWY